jgi:FlaA1/EpsC-like NDP-sugar epimerase
MNKGRMDKFKSTRFPTSSRQLLLAIDIVAWAMALVLVTLLRWEGYHHSVVTRGLVLLIMVAVVCQIAIGWLVLYRYTWIIGSFEEMAALTCTTLVTSAIVITVDTIWFRRSVPGSAAVGGCALAVLTMVTARGAWRWHRDTKVITDDLAPGAIIFGAGDVARQTIDLLVGSESRPWWPVALLDDRPSARSQQLRHLKVSGGRDDIASVARDTQATAMIIAIPSAPAETVRTLTDLAEEAGLDVSVLPPAADLFRRSVQLDDIKPVTEADLLGRRVIDTEIDSIAHYLTGHRVLVTGAGGSIGSELCRQIKRFEPERLVLLDRDESGLHEVQLSIEGRAMLDSRDLVVCDIRDAEALDDVFAEHQPHVIFHAAALKHLSLLEMWPNEAIKTNVLGTINLLDAATKHGVKTFVNISTDKAADPISVLGLSKRISERLTSTFAERQGEAAFLNVRFGNVLGSRGSVLTAFQAQVEAGAPITVTHPEVTRFFMTIEEAVQLVIQAGAIGRDGDVLILDMGDPVRIEAIALRLARAADPPAQVVYTGLRPGEKLHEQLFSSDEVPGATTHELIHSCAVPAISLDQIRALDATSTNEVAKAQLVSFATSPSTEAEAVGAAAEADSAEASNIRHLRPAAGARR